MWVVADNTCAWRRHPSSPNKIPVLHGNPPPPPHSWNCTHGIACCDLESSHFLPSMQACWMCGLPDPAWAMACWGDGDVLEQTTPQPAGPTPMYRAITDSQTHGLRPAALHCSLDLSVKLTSGGSDHPAVTHNRCEPAASCTSGAHTHGSHPPPCLHTSRCRKLGGVVATVIRSVAHPQRARMAHSIRSSGCTA